MGRIINREYLVFRVRHYNGAGKVLKSASRTVVAANEMDALEKARKYKLPKTVVRSEACRLAFGIPDWITSH